MRATLATLGFSLAFALAAPAICEAKVQITIDLSRQTMDVNGAGGSYSWPISSARSGFVTPRGTYGVQSLQPMHYSKKYHNSPMPHSIFFNGGFAIHGTYDLANLGRPASHGCVRISPANAATLFALVRQEGATIRIVGDASNATYVRNVDPESAAPASRLAAPRAAEARPPRATPVRIASTQTASPLEMIFGFAAPSEPAAAPQKLRARR
jgi:hypothetical protein